ncbi:MAG: DMT family transporter [Rhodospirillales bacterium]|nr:DMT family transporter [Rhodospirillales bacterium]
MKAVWFRLPASLRGSLWMILAGVFFTILSIMIRMASKEVHILEVVFFRYFINLIIMLPWLISIGLQGLKTNNMKFYVARSTCSFLGALCWFAAMSLMPLAEATALGFTTPLFATLGAVLFLSETVRARRWIALVTGFLGTLIILRPGFAVITTPAMFAIFGALFIAGSALFVKVLSRTDSPNTIVLYTGILATPISLIPAMFIWVWPTIEGWLWLTGVGAMATFGHLAYTRAFAIADTSAVLPFDYIRLIFVAIAAFILFGEVPDIWTWIGGGIIGGATIYIAHREAAAARCIKEPAKSLPAEGTI